MPYTSEVTRGRIVGMWEAGRTVKQIGDSMQMSRAVVQYWIKRFQDRGEDGLKTQPKSGKPRKTTAEIDAKIINASRDDPFKPSTRLRRDLKLNCSLTTVRNRLREAGIHHPKAAKKIDLSEQHCNSQKGFPKDEERRKLWVQAHQRDSWTPSTQSVLCSDHFTSDSFDHSSHGLRRLKPKAVFPAFPMHLQKKSTGDIQASTSAADAKENEGTSSSNMESHDTSASPDKHDNVMKINNGLYGYCELDTKVEVKEEETVASSEYVMNINNVTTYSNKEMDAKEEIKEEALDSDNDLQHEEHLPFSEVIMKADNGIIYSNRDIDTKTEIKEEALD